ncbi:hypothetical protein [Achromobacter aegrifaciens]
MSVPTDVSGEPAGSVSEAGHYQVSLTAAGSHVFAREAGRGNLIIGPASMGKKADLHVAGDEAINWAAFEPFSTPAGSPWPRHIDYYGNDSGFFGWSRGREIEQFSWAPAYSGRRAIDAGAARIQTLRIRLDQVSGHLEARLPQVRDLELFGDLTRIAVAGELPDMLSLRPALGRRTGVAPYALPDLGPLQDVRALALHGAPLGQPISLQGIDRFPELESLSLWGGFSGWEALARLPRLTSLEIRFTPDLDGLPELASWPALDRFIAYNVDEAAGKRLKAQMKAREKVRAWGGYNSVSQLRKREWWQSEYGRPFSGWNSRMAKSANTAYDTARSALESASNTVEVQAAISVFTRHFNGMKGIETSEREDIGEAVWQFSQLAQVERLGVSEAQTQRWFDEARDY